MTHPLTTHARALLAAALKRAPAPWLVDLMDDEGDRVDAIRDAHGQRVVECDSGVYPPCAPVATLIAAAPTLIADLCTALDAAQGDVRDAEARHASVGRVAAQLREDMARLNQACADVATQRDTALAEAARLRAQLAHLTAEADAESCAALATEAERLRALVVEACDMADMLAALMPSLYRQEFGRRDGARLATIRTEALK